MKIEVTRGIVTDEKGKHFKAGETLELDTEKARRLIRLGYAKETEGKPEKKEKPEGKPDKKEGS